MDDENEIPKGNFMVMYRGMKLVHPEGAGPLGEMVDYIFGAFVEAGVMKYNAEGNLEAVNAKPDILQGLEISEDGSRQLTDDELTEGLNSIRGPLQ